MSACSGSVMPPATRSARARLFVLALSLAQLILLVGPLAPASVSAADDITFEDEFNGTAIDTTKWDTSIATSGNRWCDVQAGTANNGTWFDTAAGSCHSLKQGPPYGTLIATTTSPGTANFAAGSNRAFPYM